MFKRKQFSIGKNIFLGYSPEREDPEMKNFLFLKTYLRLFQVTPIIAKKLSKKSIKMFLIKFMLVKILKQQNLQSF